MHISDDLDTLTILECVVEWNYLAIDLGDRELIAELGVDCIREIHRSRSLWEGDDISLGCEDEDLIREDIHTHLTHECLPFDRILDDTLDGLDPIAILRLGRSSLLSIFEMRCHSDLCLKVHLWCTDLYLCRLRSDFWEEPDDGGME